MVDGDSLYVPVSFDCCFGEYHFEFQFSVREDESKIWNKKLTLAEPCTGLCFQWLKAKLPKKVLSSNKIILLGLNKVEVLLINS